MPPKQIGSQRVEDIAIIRETLAELDQDDEELTALDLENHNF